MVGSEVHFECRFPQELLVKESVESIEFWIGNRMDTDVMYWDLKKTARKADMKGGGDARELSGTC